MSEQISREDFLDMKRDYSPLLVHLCKDYSYYDDDIGNVELAAHEALDNILNGKTLIAYNYYCLLGKNLDSQSKLLQDRFKVVCFTETPIDQIDVLLEEVHGRKTKLKPYGLVLKKEYIRQHGGNPVFYGTTNIIHPFWDLYWSLLLEESPSKEKCNLLALVNRCDETIDFHWEREWRIVGDLEFNYDDIYCGLCPEEKMSLFEDSYPQVKFISPYWGINKILDKLVGQIKK